MSHPPHPRAAVVVRGETGAVTSYRDYRPALRRDFWYSCAYCTISEIEATAIGFEIDHYLPRSTHPGLVADYANLYWSCQPCNRHKAGFSPGEEDIRAGREIIRADLEHPRDHLADAHDGSGEWIALTAKGRFNIWWLDLNRPPLIRLRRVRRRLAESSTDISFGVADILAHGVDAVRKEHKGYLAKLHLDARSLARQWEDGIEAYIRQCLASPLLDDTPASARRRHLQDEAALVPGTTRRPSNARPHAYRNATSDGGAATTDNKRPVGACVSCRAEAGARHRSSKGRAAELRGCCLDILALRTAGLAHSAGIVAHVTH